MSVVSLIINASIVVQLVMLILFTLSMISWYMIWQRQTVLSKTTKALQNFEERFWSGMDLSRLFVQVNTEPNHFSGEENIFRAGFKEFARLRKGGGSEAEAVMEGTERAMRVALLREQEKLELHLSFLATVGSTSPYIGLFGTVWGIMHSFLALANQTQATLSVVAPGIAEALIATAIGLFAAIPAVISYNRFSSVVDHLLHNYETFMDEFSSILHRKAHASEAEAKA
ncbi:protein TolQ [Ketobacter alkanivorans]|uniref:Tol-Pal system protein TolQ n=1 Tax=Ketobacter alkanivorans TaxID=1917421 RepID=A0A2K9LQK0_9GAMM|nr:protein TolQ [Ketobacter alkanivorans]AUM14563.1 protein TolQ [Ketobacter alkanivorans]MCP5013970.1 protein TolQ [Ketobacter sp.]